MGALEVTRVSDEEHMVGSPKMRVDCIWIVLAASLLVSAGLLGIGIAIGVSLYPRPVQSVLPSGKYVAAAIQLERADVPATTPLDMELQINMEAYRTQVAAAMAANPNVELVLLPEGANGWFPNTRVNRSNIHAFGDRIPAVSNGVPLLVPCTSPSYANASQLKQLSCLAYRYSIVLVADLIEVRSCEEPFEVGDPPCPSDHQLLFNTAVAIGQDGAVLAKYNKRHIAGTLGILDEPTPSRLPRFFDATFRNARSVRFGLMICQDLAFTDVVYEYLALNITNILFSTHFSNLAPIFLMGLHFEGFSRVHHINFLVANGASAGSRGGGIFSQGQALSYFWDTLPPATAPTHGITTATVPLLPRPSWVQRDATLAMPPTAAIPQSGAAQCTYIDAFSSLKTACVMFQPDRSNPVTVAQALELASGLRCELVASIRSDAADEPLDKWALLVATIPLPPETECDGLHFSICMATRCPNFPDCRNAPLSSSTTWLDFRLTTHGMPPYKSSFLPAVVGVGGYPAAWTAGGWSVASSALGDASRMSSGDTWQAQPLTKLVWSAVSPYKNICWDSLSVPSPPPSPYPIPYTDAYFKTALMAGGPPCDTSSVEGYPAALEALFSPTVGPAKAAAIAADSEVAGILASFRTRIETGYSSTKPAVSFEVTLGAQTLAFAHGGQISPSGGRPNDQTVYTLGSVTKIFTSLTTFQQQVSPPGTGGGATHSRSSECTQHAGVHASARSHAPFLPTHYLGMVCERVACFPNTFLLSPQLGRSVALSRFPIQSPPSSRCQGGRSRWSSPIPSPPTPSHSVRWHHRPAGCTRVLLPHVSPTARRMVRRAGARSVCRHSGSQRGPNAQRRLHRSRVTPLMPRPHRPRRSHRTSRLSRLPDRSLAPQISSVTLSRPRSYSRRAHAPSTPTQPSLSLAMQPHAPPTRAAL